MQHFSENVRKMLQNRKFLWKMKQEWSFFGVVCMYQLPRTPPPPRPRTLFQSFPGRLSRSSWSGARVPSPGSPTASPRRRSTSAAFFFFQKKQYDGPKQIHVLGNSGIKFEVEGGEGSPGADTYIPPPKKLQSCFISHRKLRFCSIVLKFSKK